MAKAIATIGGVGLAPGVSRNRRWYTREHIAGAVTAAQERLARGDEPMVMLSHHDAGDDSLRIAAALRSVSLTEDGRVRWQADIPDTDTGREIAALADTSDGKPAFLEGVSIRGRWTGRVRQVKAPDNQLAEQGEGLLIDGLDFTHKPGVPGARIDTFAWAKGGASETDERVLITESVEEARVTITEETTLAAPQVPEGVREALRAVFGETVAGGNTPSVSKRDSGLSDDNGRTYADPGYQADKKQRYDVSSKVKAKAAYAYLSKPANAKAYTGPQLKRVMGRIKGALKKFGVTVAAEGWCIDPAIELTEALAEYAGMDPECAGSYSLSATNGPTTVTVCSYGLDPADLHVILAQACSAASAALCSIDPDMDGDIDVPGADAEDTDGDMAGGDDDMDNGDGVEDLVSRLMSAIRGESAEDLDALIAEAKGVPAVTETAPEPAPDPAAEPQETGEEPAVSEATTNEAVQAPAAASIPQDVLDAAVASALAADKAARKARKAAKAAESAPAASVTESDDARIARIVEERLAAARAAEGTASVAETEEQRVERMVQERLTAQRQAATAAGNGPGRKGLVTEHSASRESAEVSTAFMKDGAVIPMEQWTEEQRAAAGAALQMHVLGDKAVF